MFGAAGRCPNPKTGAIYSRPWHPCDERCTVRAVYSSPDMHRRHRLAGFASIVLLLQLVLVGGGFGCVMPGVGAHGATATSDAAGMAGMGMPSVPSVPSQLPWAPAGCQPMAPCAPAAVTAAQFVLALPVVDATPVAALDIATPSSRTTPPEIPPPRA